VLEGALRRRPGDLPLLLALGDSYGTNQADRLRWHQAAVAAHPTNVAAHFKLGTTLLSTDPDGAVAELREAVRLDPSLVVAYVNLGVTLEVQRDPEGAVAEYREAVRRDPRYYRAHHHLAYILATGPDRLRDGRQAVEHATRACELTAGKDPTCLAALAAAYAEVGDFDRAVEFQKRGLAAPDAERRFGKVGEAQLRLYEQKKPYRSPWLARREVAPPPRGKP
jgi:Flp pilus assembly protein TadD